MQKTRSALNVLHEVLCSSQSKQLLFRSFFIISRKFHHFSMRREISMTRAFDDVSLWFKNEWDIRHTILFFRFSNLLIWFVLQSIRSWFVRISIIEVFHYIECISKSLRIISNSIFIVFLSFNKKLNSTIIFASVENIIHFSFFFVIYNYRRRELVNLFK